MQRGVCAKKNLFLLLFFACSANCFAQGQGYYFRFPPVHHRFSVGTTYSFFSKDPHVIKNIRPLIGYTGSYSAEIEILDNASLLVGLTYTNLAVQFNSYFAAPGHTYVFDGSFAYVHRLRYQSVQLPIGLKFNLLSEADNSFTPYFLLGIGFNYILSAKTTIT